MSEAPLEIRTRKSLLYVIPREGKEFIVVAPPGLQIDQVLRSLKPFDFTSGDLSDNGCIGTILFQGQEIANFKWSFI